MMQPTNVSNLEQALRVMVKATAMVDGLLEKGEDQLDAATKPEIQRWAVTAIEKGTGGFLQTAAVSTLHSFATNMVKSLALR